jgi:hypothetical protein
MQSFRRAQPHKKWKIVSLIRWFDAQVRGSFHSHAALLSLFRVGPQSYMKHDRMMWVKLLQDGGSSDDGMEEMVYIYGMKPPTGT